MISTRIGRFVAIGAMAALVVAGCAKDEPGVDAATTTAPVTASSGPDTEAPGTTEEAGGSGGSGELCDLLTEFNDLSEDTDLDEGLALIDEIKDLSPDDIAADWDILADTATQVDALGDDASFDEVEPLLSEPEFVAAAHEIDDWAKDECGEGIGLDVADDLEGQDDLGGSTTDSTDDEVKPASIKAVKAHLEGEYGAEVWVTAIAGAPSWGRTSSGGTADWGITLADDADVAALATEDLVAGCDAIADYLDQYEDAEITIKDANDQVLVTRAAGGSCEAA